MTEAPARDLVADSAALPTAPHWAESALDAERRLFLTALVVVPLALGRLQIPVGPPAAPLLLIVVPALVAFGTARGHLRVSTRRAGAFLIVLAACSAVALIDLAGPKHGSAKSLLYLTLAYLPWSFVDSRTSPETTHYVLTRFRQTMLAVAGLALLQFGAQLAGGPRIDPISSLPAKLLLANFNTAPPLRYGSNIHKSNAIFFVEPSVASQFLALGILVTLAQRRRTREIMLLGVAVVTTVSGTGLLLLAAGLLPLAMQRGASVLRPLATMGIAAVALAAVTPLGSSLVARSGQNGDGRASANLRFVDPYQMLWPGVVGNDRAFLIGHGPGSSERRIAVLTDSAVVASPPTKLPYDFGVPVAMLFLGVLGWALWGAHVEKGVAVGLIMGYLVLNGSTLFPSLTTPMWVLTGLLNDAPDPREHTE